MTTEDNTTPDEGEVEGHRVARPTIADEDDDVEGHRVARPTIADEDDELRRRI
jgi:hypothetical protein